MIRAGIFFFLLTVFAQAQLQHFTGFPDNGEEYQVVVQLISIDGIPTEANDEIGLFDNGPNGIGLVGAAVISGSYPLVVTAYLADTVGGVPIPGAITGNDISFKIWDASENNELNALPYFNYGGTYGFAPATNADSVRGLNIYQQNLLLQTGWNLTAVPYKSASMEAGTLFPDSDADVFGYEGSGYVSEDTLQNGIGYWVHYPSDMNVTVSGTMLPDEFVYVSEGWNLLGVYDRDIPVSSVYTVPPGIITSDFFAYGSGYYQLTILTAGVGFWVRCSQSGILYLP